MATASWDSARAQDEEGLARARQRIAKDGEEVDVNESKLKVVLLILLKTFIAGAIGGVVALQQSGSLQLDWRVIGWAALSGGVVAVLSVAEQYFDKSQTAFGLGSKSK